MNRLVRALCCALLALAPCIQSVHAQQALNNAAILKLKTAGLGDDVIISTITNSPGHYSTSTDDLIALKKAGVSDRVMSAMLQKNSSVSPSSALTPVATPTGTAPPGVTDVGVYYQDNAGQWQDMMTEIVNYKTGGVLKGLASGGIVKGDLNGNIAGGASKLQLHSPVAILIYVLEGQSPNEYQLLRLRPNNNNREFRSKTGGVVHQSTGAARDLVDFESKKIAPRIYQVTLPATTGKGEYGFLPPGNMNSQDSAASSGKIYSFSLVE